MAGLLAELTRVATLFTKSAMMYLQQELKRGYCLAGMQGIIPLFIFSKL